MKQYSKLACSRFIDEISKAEVVSGITKAIEVLAADESATAASAVKAAGATAGIGVATVNPPLLFVALALFMGSTWFQHRGKAKGEDDKRRMADELAQLRRKLETIAQVQEADARARQIEEIIDAAHRPLAELPDEDRCYAYIASNAMATYSWGDFTQAQVLEALGIIGNDSNERIRRIKTLLEKEEIRRIQKFWQFEREYLTLIEIALRNVRVDGYDSEVAGKRIDRTLSEELRLEDTFISLNLTEDTPGSAAAPIPFEYVLDELEPGPSGRLLIRGYAGMGKSTLVNWAVRTAAAGAASGKSAADRRPESSDSSIEADDKRRPGIWRRRIPFRIRMRDCPNWTIPADRSEFTALTGPGIPKAPAGWVEDVLREGRAAVFIDGLDEVPTGYRPKSFEALRVLIESAGEAHLNSDGNDPRGNLFVMTSRRLAEDPTWLESLGFRQTLIAPLGRNDRDLLMGRWYNAAARAHPERADQFERKKELIRGELDANPDVAQLTDSPLMCTVICNLCPTPDDRLPQQPQDVLELVCKLLTSHRDLAYFQTAPKPAWSREFEQLQYKGRKEIAAAFAYQMLLTNEPYLIEERAIELLREDFPRRGFEPDRARTVLDEFGLRIGLLRFLHPEKRRGLEFCHNVFKEYLAAAHIVASKEEKRQWLLKNLEQEDCRNALRHAITSASEEICDALVEGLLDAAQADTRLGRDLRLLAVRSVPHGVSIHPGLRKRVAAIVDSLVPPKSEEEADALAQVAHHLPEDALRRLRHVPELNEGQKLLNIRVLRQSKSPPAKKMLRQYIEHADSEEQVAELASEVPVLSLPWAWDQFSQGRFLRSILRRITDRDTQRIAREFRGPKLDLSLSKITDAGLTDLARPDTGLRSLRELNLYGTAVTDAGLRELARADTGLKELETLNLRYTRITNAGLGVLARASTGLRFLTTLSLTGTQVTDAGLEALLRPDSGLKALAHLFLARTQVTEAMRSRLHKALPRLILIG